MRLWRFRCDFITTNRWRCIFIWCMQTSDVNYRRKPVRSCKSHITISGCGLPTISTSAQRNNISNSILALIKTRMESLSIQSDSAYAKCAKNVLGKKTPSDCKASRDVPWKTPTLLAASGYSTKCCQRDFNCMPHFSNLLAKQPT